MKPSSCQASHGPAGNRSGSRVSTVTQPTSGFGSRWTEPPSADASAWAPKQMPRIGTSAASAARSHSIVSATHGGPSPRAVAPEPSATANA